MNYKDPISFNEFERLCTQFSNNFKLNILENTNMPYLESDNINFIFMVLDECDTRLKKAKIKASELTKDGFILLFTSSLFTMIGIDRKPQPTR
ncbi:hypothetical protein MD588_08610 [Photobacterium sp. SDRW27]|uniref:hypothetical protein n=1 Tax=Photobacterium obscurum TaxID=2829490 RepID=UPI0022439E26|nr:hypothetical protein [Photobacterium obscurum]MCW8328869.1 hypothetical protein [Photobacterium obscurum]